MRRIELLDCTLRDGRVSMVIRRKSRQFLLALLALGEIFQLRLIHNYPLQREMKFSASLLLCVRP